MKRILFATIALALLSTAAAAQTSVTDGLAGLGEASASGRIVQMIAAVTVLSVAPGLLIMVTSLHPLRHRLVVPALRAWAADDAGQPDPDQSRPVHDLLRHGADTSIRPGRTASSR